MRIVNFKALLLILLSVTIGYHLPIHAQFLKVPEFSTEAGAVVSTGRQTPFWLFANQYGMITTNLNNQWIRFRLNTSFSTSNIIDYDYGIDVIGRHSRLGQLYLNQAYIRLKIHFLALQVGKMEEIFGNQDSMLSSGGLLWSGNARSMPKISINVPKYTSVPFTRGFIEFKGGLSHGWFGDNRFVNDSWLHHKYFYIQAGGKLPVHIHYGFHHFAQWGGVSTDTGIAQMPRKFNDFIKVFFARQGGSGSSMNDQLNALGNHLGSRNFGIDFEANRFKVSLYWQTVFEDSSGLKYRNIKDGLWGISLHTKKKRLLSGFVYEFVHTTDQSGKYSTYWVRNDSVYLFPVPGGFERLAGGNDDYFNNSIYRYGWTYKNFTIGSPLITSQKMLMNSDTESGIILNNKIFAHHFGIEGSLRNITYMFMFTYSMNYGTNVFPIKPSVDQYSILLNLQLHDKLPWGLDACFDLAIDWGELYGNNLGFKFSFSKIFKKSKYSYLKSSPISNEVI